MAEKEQLFVTMTTTSLITKPPGGCCAWDNFAVCHEILILNFREVFSLASDVELRDLQNTLRQYFTGDCIAVSIYHSGTSIW